MSFFNTFDAAIDFDKVSDLHRHPLTGINVLVIGAGPVGLYTALECWRKGHHVVGVLERTPAPSAAGDSFTVLASHIQRSWPRLFQALKKVTFEMNLSFYKLNGELVKDAEPFSLENIAQGRANDDGEVKKTEIIRVNRAVLAALFLGQARELGIEISYGKRVVDYFEDDIQAGVVLEDGSRASADVVVAADGIGTKSHRLINGHDVRAMPSKHSIFRASYANDPVISDPELNDRFLKCKEGSSEFQLWTGKGLSIAIASFPKEIQWYMTHEDTVGISKESWHNFVTPEQVIDFLSAYPEVPDIFKKLVKTAPPESIIDWQILWRDPQPKWHSTRVVQAGDSAHTFVPSSGSGVNQGLEDAVSIATCLQIGGNVKNGMWAKVHNKLRFERISCCQLMGFINQSHYLKAEWGANALDDPKNYRPEYGWWVMRHNPERYAFVNYGNALRNIIDGTPFQNTNIPSGYVHKPWTLQVIYDTLAEGKKLKFDGDWS
ncbi:putative monooxygenase [Coniella lustricola]|uniref:Putative monooxygenase n=1 Tax=Coniella lustricola TaxID=2025994 RepID=A0A2T3A060_9PEZI|nr:putative monooxygenase [Coniella lustricola]